MKKYKLIAVCLGVAGIVSISMPSKWIVYAAECTGNVLQNGVCSAERPCDIAHGCVTALEVATVEDICVSGLPADNCVELITKYNCVNRVGCEMNENGDGCIYSSNVIGISTRNHVKEGGNCTISN